MLRKTLFLMALFCAIYQQHLYSQSITCLDHAKYWHLRQKLISDLLVIGNENIPCTDYDINPGYYGGCGLSMPTERYNTSSSFFAGNGKNHIGWGDGTSNLGWYIAVLATELKLLYNNNQNWKPTQYELYCALKAYERIDETTESIAFPYESYFGGNIGAPSECDLRDLNGFFIRDDVDSNLFKNHSAFAAKYQAFDNTSLIHTLSLSYGGTSNPSNCLDYPSPDQCAYLFMGFALVDKCLGGFPVKQTNSPRFYTPPGPNQTNVDLVQLAETYTYNIATFYMNSDLHPLLANGEDFNYDNILGFGTGYGFCNAEQK